MLVTNFFAKQQVFITGGSGFIGKVLVEKLLRTCPDIGNIYLLIRGKKGQTTNERLEKILKLPLFNRLREENPKALEKVYAIEGDCMKLGLGISNEDLQKLQNITIIYHAAASVRFDDSLRDAILMNTRSTYELIKIAETMKKLKVFMHISTTYCNPDQHIVEEKIYPPYADWRTTIKLAETYDTETLNMFNLKYSNFQPNTYTFTKSLAEQIVNDYKDKLPMVILRPSIVISSIEEPIPGWIDNFNGPIGLLIACGTGIMRSNYSDPDVVSDYVPVDVVVRSIMTATYKKGIDGHKPNADNLLVIYNCAASNVSGITAGDLIELGKCVIKKNPFEKTIWYPDGSITRCPYWHLIRFIFFHILVAIILDTILRCTKSKPFLLKIQRRIYAANMALHYFTTVTWIFNNDNTLNLDKIVPPEEIKKFGILQYSDIDHEELFANGLRGAKEYLLNETASCSDAGRMRFKIMQILHYTVQAVVALLFIRFLINRFVYKFIF